jgi:ribosomal-protein-alanine N-acetyltransferase
VQYRLYTPADFPALYAVEELCFQPPWRFSRAYMRQIVRNPQSATWIAEEGSDLAGLVVVQWKARQGEPTAYIETIEVHPEWRGRGIGVELLGRAEGSARAAGASAIGLHVRVDNETAIRLYEGHGYTCRGREEYYYAREPALFYAKPLSESPKPRQN